MGRIACHFSAGAASAVATKLALATYGKDRTVIFNAFIKEEHPDNRRFVADCEKWFDHPITVLRDTKYGASVHEIWRRKGFMNSIYGAPCSAELKREVLAAVSLPDDTNVFGFTCEETDRAKKFLDVGGICPLIDRNLSKADCLAMVERAGIELPIMYRLGFNNANCIGCCKGGEGYWNHVRQVFPEVFEQVAQIQDDINNSGCFMFRNRKTGERFSLRELPPDKGRHDTTLPDCSFFCAMAEDEIRL